MHRRSPARLFVGAVLVMSMLGLPLLEFTTGALGSPLWIFLDFFVCGSAFIAVVLIPGLHTAPVRKLRRKYIAENRGALVSIVGTWDDESLELGILVADAQGVTLRAARVEQPVVIPWTLIDSVTVVKSETDPDEQVELATSGPHGVIRFCPIRANGVQLLDDWRLAEYVTELRESRLRTDAS